MSTSKLQRYMAQRLKCNLPHLEIKENYKPNWLQNPNGALMELDFFIPELKIAIEIQGEQHYKFSPFFHKDYNEFLDQKKRDEIKRITCSIEDIRLIEIDTEAGVNDLIDKLYLTDGCFIVDPTIKRNTLDIKTTNKIKRNITKTEQRLTFVRNKLNSKNITQEKRDNLMKNQFGLAKHLYELKEKLYS